jgi:protein arginine N-methyltransferase 1
VSKAISRTVEDDSLLGQFIPLHYHFNMLLDEARMTGFREAIGHVVRPGMRVVELGGGTGVLSFFAAQRGATVECVERNPALAGAAARFLEHNGCADSVRVIQADAMRFVPSEPVDVVVCEMLHVGLLREKQLQVIDQFKSSYRQRFGEQLPVFIPEASLLAAQPVEQDFNFSGYHAAVPLFQAPGPTHAATTQLAKPQLYAMVCYDSTLCPTVDWRASFLIEQSGIVNAIRLLTKNVLAIQLAEQRTIEWSNQYLVLPLAQPLVTHAGETIELALAYEAGAALESVQATASLVEVSMPTPVAA